MLAAVSPATRLVFLANPNNPTGSMLPYEEVARLRAGLPPEVLLVLDAAYAEYVARPDYDPGARLVDATDNTVMTRTFTKVFGLGGMRIGWAYAPPAVIDVLNRVRGAVQRLDRGAGRRDRRAGRAGLGGEGARPQPGIPAEAGGGLEAAGIKVWPSEGNFVLADFGVPERARGGRRVPAHARHHRPRGRRLRPAALPAHHRRHRRGGAAGDRGAGRVHASVFHASVSGGRVPWLSCLAPSRCSAGWR